MTSYERMSAARREGELEAGRLLAELRLAEGHQIDVFGIIEQMGVWLFFQELKGVLGVYLPGLPASGILINSTRTFGVQRLTAAHELGHHVLKHSGGLDDEISLRAAPGRRDKGAKRLPFDKYLREIAAQAFATSFLAPATLVRDMMTALGIERDGEPAPEQIYELSLHLGMSYEATVHRLAALREVNASNLDRLLISPAGVKRKVGHGQRPESSYADVWPIGSRQLGALINARVGDELAISLDEIPSSGYRWVLEQGAEATVVRSDGFISAASHGPEPRAGAGGRRNLTVRVVRPGENRILLACVRTWKAREPSRQFYFMVDAEELAGKDFAPRPSTKRALLEAAR